MPIVYLLFLVGDPGEPDVLLGVFSDETKARQFDEDYCAHNRNHVTRMVQAILDPIYRPWMGLRFEAPEPEAIGPVA